MKIKITSGTPKVAVAGLGIVATGEWVDVTKEQEKAFEAVSGKKLKEAFEVKKETRSKKEAS